MHLLSGLQVHGAAIYSAMPLSSEIPTKDHSLNVNHTEGNQIEKTITI
jgi:hypothetical protein